MYANTNYIDSTTIILFINVYIYIPVLYFGVKVIVKSLLFRTF